MSNGFGAAFGGLMLFAALVLLAALLVVMTGVSLSVRDRWLRPVASLATGLVVAVVAVATFAIAALVDEAPMLAALFVATVAIPLVLVAGRIRSRGTPWVSVVARSGMAWSLPFLVGVGLLYVLVVTTDRSAGVTTGLAGVVTTFGTLLAGEYVETALTANGTGNPGKRSDGE